MVRVCAFPGCFSREKALRLRPQGSAQDESLTFHTLPLHDPERLKLWLLALHRDINSSVESIRALRVCSQHFSPEDFPGPNRRYLKSTAVPGHLVPTEERYAEAELQMEGELSASSQSTEAVSPPSLTFAAGFPLDSEDSTEELDPHSHQMKLQEETDEENGEDRGTNPEDTAQCSEELVITKIEDFTNEMPIDVDYTVDHSGRMELDEPENAETQTAKDDRNRRETCGTQTQPVSVVQPAVGPSVKIKDEPIDEECRKAPQTTEENIKDHETPDGIKIRAEFSVGGNATSVGAPAAAAAKAPSAPAVSVPAQASLPAQTSLWPVGLVCAGCKRIILKGKTALQRSGSPKLYCSPQCLCITAAIVVKKRTCHHCLKEISDPKAVHFAPVDTSGTTKEFCSQKCIGVFNVRCSVCQKTGVTHGHEVKSMGSIQKLCSDACFNQFLSSNKLTMNCCMNCGGHCNNTDGLYPTLQIEGNAVKFCTQKCLTTYKQRRLKTVACKICGTMRPAAEMVEGSLKEGVKELFCSASCAMKNTVQTVGSSGVAVECQNCKMKLVAQYHLAMFDGTVLNFCSFPCVVSYQALIDKKKSHKETNKITSTRNPAPIPVPAVPKPAPAQSSSSVKTSSSSGRDQSVTKLPCAQCLLSFIHKPELLEFKKKMYVFCDKTCVEAFRKKNINTARCEYCKTVKVVKIVKRINRVERTFCGQECETLFEDDMLKQWGKKYCRDCKYCDASSKNLVTGVFDDKQEKFCGNQCYSKYTSLVRQEIKCTMCKQVKPMAQTVKWLGDMKHFCSLRCLMFLCSLQGITGAVTKTAGKSQPAEGATPVSSAVHQSTKETTPVIANVIPLSGTANGEPGVLGSTDLNDCVPSITVEVSDDESFPEKTVSPQKRTVRTSAPPPRIQKSKISPHNPTSKNRATSCKPNTRDAETQSDEMPKVIVLPVPVPVYVPVPMNLYSQYVPQTVGLPLPVPVPLFLPTTLDSAECIVKTIQEIKEKIPDDPLEADLIMMAEMVAEDAEKEKHNTTSDQTGKIMDNLDLEDLSSNLSWEEDSVSSAQTCDQTPELEKPPSKTPITNPTEEPQMDLEADFPVESIELLRKQTQKGQQVSNSVKQKPRKKGCDSVSKKRLVSKCAPAVTATSDGPTDLSKLQHEYGVSAWRDWVHWRNCQTHVETPKFGSRSMTLKEDLLKCSTAELSFGLSKFISEVRRPNGEKYSPDSIFYLCLGIQQNLFENSRMENIFADALYSRFCQDIANMLKGWTPTILPSGYVHSRIEEEYLWDCKQLGAFSPSVLLNTLLYFFTKFFNCRTVEQHRRLSFGHFKRYCRGQGRSKVVYLLFYPHKEDTSTDGVPAKKRKKEDERGKLRIKENSENPFRCPVRLYEFYLSKCSPSVRHSTTQFYLNPERSCVPSSPTWFSMSSLSSEALENMLSRILTVRELHMQVDKLPPESDFDSDTD